MQTLKMKTEKELTEDWLTTHLRDRGITRLSGWKPNIWKNSGYK